MQDAPPAPLARASKIVAKVFPKVQLQRELGRIDGHESICDTIVWAGSRQIQLDSR